MEGFSLTMYGQMMAGSWINIGTQGVLQVTYETLVGRLTITAGLGGAPSRSPSP